MNNHHHDNSKYLFSTLINAVYIVFEFVVGIFIGSVSLISDAVHNLSDVLGIIIAYIGSVLAKTKATDQHTYGLRNATIIAAFFNALILVAAIVFLLFETIQKFFEPVSHIQGGVVAVVAFIGVVINGLTAFFFHNDAKKDVNQKGVYLHFLTDVAVSIAVVIGGILIQITGWNILDPIISLIAIVAVSFAAFALLKETWRLITNGVPENISEPDVKKYIKSFPGIKRINDLHIWGISTTQTALTAHLECAGKKNDSKIIDEISDGLRSKFGITHTTIQIDTNKSHHIEPDD